MSNLWFFNDSNTLGEHETEVEGDKFEDSLSEIPDENLEKEESGEVKEVVDMEEVGISDGVFISEEQEEQTGSNVEKEKKSDGSAREMEETENSVSGSLLFLEDLHQIIEGEEFDNAEEEIEEEGEGKSKEEEEGAITLFHEGEAVVKEHSIFSRVAPVYLKKSFPAKLPSTAIKPIKLSSSANQAFPGPTTR